MEFLRGVLSGAKRLFLLSEVHIMDHLPRYPEICLREIWARVQADPAMQPFFPDATLQARRPPNRTFLFTVASEGAEHRLPGAV